ncbi:MAG: translation initiation factor IF-3 [Candidatus Komeilibacteria bacterium]
MNGRSIFIKINNKIIGTQKKFRINHQIKANEIFLIDHEEKIHKSISVNEALAIAKEVGLDLVEVNPTSQPPICKILDHGQFQYQQSRIRQESKQQSKKVLVKGLRLSFKIGKGDLLTRRKQAEKFLKKGHKVRMELMLRGREKQHTDLAIKLVDDFIASIEGGVNIDQAAKRKGNTISAQVSPK